MRVVVRYRLPGIAPEEEARAILAASGATRVDGAPRMMLLEGELERIESALRPFPGWAASEETELRVPPPPHQGLT